MKRIKQAGAVALLSAVLLVGVSSASAHASSFDPDGSSIGFGTGRRSTVDPFYSIWGVLDGGDPSPKPQPQPKTPPTPRRVTTVCHDEIAYQVDQAGNVTVAGMSHICEQITEY